MHHVTSYYWAGDHHTDLRSTQSDSQEYRRNGHGTQAQKDKYVGLSRSAPASRPTSPIRASTSLEGSVITALPRKTTPSTACRGLPDVGLDFHREDQVTDMSERLEAGTSIRKLQRKIRRLHLRNLKCQDQRFRIEYEQATLDNCHGFLKQSLDDLILAVRTSRTTFTPQSPNANIDDLYERVCGDREAITEKTETLQALRNELVIHDSRFKAALEDLTQSITTYASVVVGFVGAEEPSDASSSQSFRAVTINRNTTAACEVLRPQRRHQCQQRTSF